MSFNFSIKFGNDNEEARAAEDAVVQGRAVGAARDAVIQAESAMIQAEAAIIQAGAAVIQAGVDIVKKLVAEIVDDIASDSNESHSKREQNKSSQSRGSNENGKRNERSQSPSKNGKEPPQYRPNECKINFYGMLVNPIRKEKTGGTYQVCYDFVSNSGGTCEVDHLITNVCYAGTPCKDIPANQRLCITMFTEHHRRFITTGNANEVQNFHEFCRELLLTENGMYVALEYQMMVYYRYGYFFTYALGLVDMMKTALSNNLIKPDEFINLFMTMQNLFENIQNQAMGTFRANENVTHRGGVNFEMIDNETIQVTYIDDPTVTFQILLLRNYCESYDLDVAQINLDVFNDMYKWVHGNKNGLEQEIIDFIEVIKKAFEKALKDALNFNEG